MNIKFKDVAVEEIITQKINEMKRKIKLLEEVDLTREIEMNAENIAEANKIQKAYKDIIANDWNIKPIKIVVAKSDGTEIATIT